MFFVIYIPLINVDQRQFIRLQWLEISPKQSSLINDYLGFWLTNRPVKYNENEGN